MDGRGRHLPRVRLIAQEHLAPIPYHALSHGTLAASQAVEDFQCALGEANGPAAFRQRGFLIHQRAIDPVLREIDRRAQSDRPGADHHDAVTPWLT